MTPAELLGDYRSYATFKAFFEATREEQAQLQTRFIKRKELHRLIEYVPRKIWRSLQTLILRMLVIRQDERADTVELLAQLGNHARLQQWQQYLHGSKVGSFVDENEQNITAEPFENCMDAIKSRLRKPTEV